MRLDPTKIDVKNKDVRRTDGDFAITWAKTYGKGCVFYSSLGHVSENWAILGFRRCAPRLSNRP
jgi:type 1 glutamine amidotransferase